MVKWTRQLPAQQNNDAPRRRNRRGKLVTPSVQVLIVGSGKLAAELIENLKSPNIASVLPWSRRDEVPAGRSIVVHAGSGRELQNALTFCRSNNSILIELSTSGTAIGGTHPFPVIICPNVNILMVKFMAMLQSQGHLFREYPKTILESHQAAKTSAPGTAISIAQSLDVEPDRITSIRNPVVQENELGIPPDALSRHAYHRIVIGDENVSVTLETKAFGDAPYASGLARVIDSVSGRKLEPKAYDSVTLIQNGWL